MITIITVGKAHDARLRDAIQQYEVRLRPPFTISWIYIPASRLKGELARHEESERITAKLPQNTYSMLLDETGRIYSSVELAKLVDNQLSHQPVTMIIGGAYGVDEALRQQVNAVVSLSRMVFPHMVVRLLLSEQIYRMQEINRGGSYHHI